MSQLNPLTRELLLKLVYYGPGLGGKTTSLERVHSASPPENRGQIVSLATPVDRTLYFDFLPLRAPTMRGHHVRLQLFTVPGQVYFNATRKLVLTGADGIVFVADSQPERQDANLESLENLAENLQEQGRTLEQMPLVLQYNKRDLPGVLSVAQLEDSLNALAAPSFATSALTGDGVMEALDALLGKVLDDLESRGTFDQVHASTEPVRFAKAEPSLSDELGRLSQRILGVPEPALEPALADVAALAAADANRPQPTQLESESAPTGPSWAPLFPQSAQDVVAIEGAIRQGQLDDAILRIEALAVELLVRVGREAGLKDPASEPALALSLLGLDGTRWLWLRRLARRARAGGPLDVRDALLAFAALLELRSAQHRAFG
ncbi:MAG: hypothetical protein GXP55_26035 [Deltaproteobacteria bacterium]|nr:hypothetical protein [Deltaproteobacteria bacterium]